MNLLCAAELESSDSIVARHVREAIRDDLRVELLRRP
jgi:hypothetical protein